MEQPAEEFIKAVGCKTKYLFIFLFGSEQPAQPGRLAGDFRRLAGLTEISAYNTRPYNMRPYNMSSSNMSHYNMSSYEPGNMSPCNIIHIMTDHEGNICFVSRESR